MRSDLDSQPSLSTFKGAISGDELHNRNCFAYLAYIKNQLPNLSTHEQTSPPTETIPEKRLLQLLEKTQNYDEKTAYGNLYTQFLTEVETTITTLENREFKKQLLNAIFINDSKLLEFTAEHALQPVLSQQSNLSFTSIESSVTTYLNTNQKTKRNKTTPQNAGSSVGRATSSIGSTDPSKTTSIRTVRTYQYKADKKLPTEIRMGMQAIYSRKEGSLVSTEAKINPLFDAWTEAQQNEKEPEKITHVYFNLLGLDRTGYEGEREKALTNALNNQAYPNIAIITLPADKGLLDKSFHLDHKQSASASDMLQTMIDIAMGNPRDDLKTKDLHISTAIQEKLFKNSNKKEALTKLIKKSFKRILGIDDPEQTTTPYSKAELQAVYFHFMKFELPNFILTKLKPLTFNMSCKDGIDRGGVASLYYNLMKSIELKNPLTQDEFEKGLHAGAIMVKGRGVNHHSAIIWNAINNYLQNHPHTPDWLKKWRDDFAPPGSIVFFANEIDTYADKRDLEPNAKNKKEKISAAKKLSSFIRNTTTPTIEFSKAELLAIQNGRLGTLYQTIKKSGIDCSAIDKQTYLMQLRDYSDARSKNESNSNPFRNEAYSKTTKLSAAKKLIDFISSKIVNFTLNEFKAINEGNLGKLFKKIVDQGVDFTPIYLAQLKQYKNEITSRPEEYGAGFFKGAGFSKTLKIDAVSKLIDHLEGANQTFTEDDKKILRNGNLGSIISAMEKNGFSFSAAHENPAVTPSSSDLGSQPSNLSQSSTFF